MPIIHDGAHTDDWFGYSLAIGDFNHDGKLDLAIGIPRKSVMGQKSGAAVIVPSDGSWLDLAGETYVVQENVGGVSETADAYGWSLAAGDWNVDEYDDLAVGAPFEEVGPTQTAPGVFRAGAVFVHYGGPDLTAAPARSSGRDQARLPGRARSLRLVRARAGGGASRVGQRQVPGDRHPRQSVRHPDATCNKAGAVQLGVAFHGTGPTRRPDFLLHQDTGNPYNVADKPECSPEYTPWNVHYGDPGVGRAGRRAPRLGRRALRTGDGSGSGKVIVQPHTP